MKKQQKAYLYAFLSVIFWSTVSTAYKLSLRELDYKQVLFVSTFVSTLITLVYLVIDKKFYLIFATKKQEILKSALLALLNPFAYYLVLLKAYSILPAQIAQPLNYVWPIILVLLSVPLLKQKIKIISIAGMVLSFLGVIIISTQGNLMSFRIDEPLGVVLALTSSLFWALFWLLNVRDKRNEVVKLFYNFLFALIYEFFVLLFFSDFDIKIDKSFVAAIYVGFFDLGITFILWLKALQNTRTTDKISNLIYFSPAIALLFIHFILGEKIFYTTYIGLFFIILGVVVVNRKQREK